MSELTILTLEAEAAQKSMRGSEATNSAWNNGRLHPRIVLDLLARIGDLEARLAAAEKDRAPENA